MTTDGLYWIALLAPLWIPVVRLVFMVFSKKLNLQAKNTQLYFAAFIFAGLTVLIMKSGIEGFYFSIPIYLGSIGFLIAATVADIQSLFK